MALIDKRDQGSNTIYLEVVDSSICRKFKQEQTGDGWEVFTTTNPSTGQTVNNWIYRYDGVEGIIEDIQFASNPIKGTTKKIESWRIFMDAEGQKIVLTLPKNSPSADRFVKLAENINFELPVLIKTWKDTSDPARSKTAFMVSQNGVNVPQKYKVDNLPPAEEWDDGTRTYKNRESFLYKNMLNVVIPAVKAAHSGSASSEDVDTVSVEEEEIPF